MCDHKYHLTPELDIVVVVESERFEGFDGKFQGNKAIVVGIYLLGDKDRTTDIQCLISGDEFDLIERWAQSELDEEPGRGLETKGCEEYHIRKEEWE